MWGVIPGSLNVSAAAAVTLSFWVLCTSALMLSGSLRSADDTRSFVFSYSTGAINTWAFRSMLVLGEASSSAWSAGLVASSPSVTLDFVLMDDGSQRGAAGSWSSSKLITATGAGNVLATAAAVFTIDIAGVQLEKSSVATPFDVRPFDLLQQQAQLAIAMPRRPTGNACQTATSLQTACPSVCPWRWLVAPLHPSFR